MLPVLSAAQRITADWAKELSRTAGLSRRCRRAAKRRDERWPKGLVLQKSRGREISLPAGSWNLCAPCVLRVCSVKSFAEAQSENWVSCIARTGYSKTLWSLFAVYNRLPKLDIAILRAGCSQQTTIFIICKSTTTYGIGVLLYRNSSVSLENCKLRHLVPRPPFERASRFFLLHAAPLLEKERHGSLQALVSKA